jgi:hypothetical protein
MFVGAPGPANQPHDEGYTTAVHVAYARKIEQNVAAIALFGLAKTPVQDLFGQVIYLTFQLNNSDLRLVSDRSIQIVNRHYLLLSPYSYPPYLLPLYD